MLDSKQNLKVSPTGQMVYYLQQHSTILSQISQQISSIAPQVPIPSTPPPPFPLFHPSASDLRINAFWFMALTFSLSAALLAILVQQWVRDYMHIFQRYSDPLKSARIRQYLYEGAEGWYMPIVVEVVPGLLHVSLFLFFVGLGDSTLNINTTIGLSTTVPIGICGLLYIFTTLAPVIYPQAPYQNTFSGFIWYAIQKSRGRRFKDRDGEFKSVSTNMAQGQMQLSMEETKDRKDRDKRAIRWLLDNLTEDTEIESFVMSIPGSFNGEWSLEMWAEMSENDDMPVVARHSSRLRTIPNVIGLIPRRFRTRNASRSPQNAMIHRQALHSDNIHHPGTTSIHERNTIHELCRRIAHLIDTCRNRDVFASDELSRRRAHACIEAMALLVCYADAELGWFGDILQTLGDIGSSEEMRNLSLAGREQTFVVSWTCLSIMAIRAIPRNNVLFKEHAKLAVASFGELRRSDCTDRAAEKNAREVDETLWGAWERGMNLYRRISSTADTVRNIDGMQTFLESFDSETVNLKETINEVSHGITRHLPGVYFDFPDSSSEPFLQQTLELFSDPPKLRFISCRQPLNKYLDYLHRIERLQGNSPNSKSELERAIKKVFWPKNHLQRTLWSLQDLRDGGGLGFAVEVFLLTLKELLTTYTSQECYSSLYIITLKAITSDRKRYKHSLGTQNILLDAIASEHSFLRAFNYPDYITDELWLLLGDMFEGQTGPHIDSAVQQLTEYQLNDDRYGTKVSAVISRLHPSYSQI